MQQVYYYNRKKFTDNFIQTVITVNGKKVKVLYPEHPLTAWSVYHGKGLSPVFYEDMTPVMASYNRAGASLPIISQLLYDTVNGMIARSYTNTEAKGTCKDRILDTILETKSFRDMNKVIIK